MLDQFEVPQQGEFQMAQTKLQNQVSQLTCGNHVWPVPQHV